MSTIRMDNQGVLRHTQGHEGGQFAPKPITAPTEPLSGINDAETLRARVRAMFHQIVAPSSTPAELAGGSRLEEDPPRSGSPLPGPARERILVTSVTIPKIDSAIAPRRRHHPVSTRSRRDPSRVPRVRGSAVPASLGRRRRPGIPDRSHRARVVSVGADRAREDLPAAARAS